MHDSRERDAPEAPFNKRPQHRPGRMILKLLYIFIPVSVALHFLHFDPLWIFIASAIAIIPLAELMREGASHVAEHAGPAIGGLITVTFANATELILSLLLLSAGNSPALIKATISGSIISNSLLGLGLAIVIGMRRNERLAFSQNGKPSHAGLFTSMLLLSVIALVLPALFDLTEKFVQHVPDTIAVDENLSLGVSIVLILAYAANVIHTIVTQKNVLATGEVEAECTEEGRNPWSMPKALGVLLVATLAIALESELLSHSVEQAAESIALTPFFVGIIVLPLVGNAAEYFTAIHFARRDRIDITMSIAVGSSIQVALLTAPVLVLASYFMGHPIDLVFGNPLELFAMISVAAIVNSIAQDDEVVWFEGVLLLSVYILLGVSFYFLTPG
jgi:Ca2+:H+ antiporter